MGPSIMFESSPESGNQDGPIARLPTEILLMCSRYMDRNELNSLIRSCRFFRDALGDELLREHALPSEDCYREWCSHDSEGKTHENKGNISDEDLEMRDSWEMPYEPLVTAISDGNHDLVRRFLKSGVNPNALSLTSFPMLHLAIHNHHYAITELLLDSGADPNIECRVTKNLALDSVTRSYNHAYDWVDLLLSHGAKFTTTETFEWFCETGRGDFFCRASRNGTNVIELYNPRHLFGSGRLIHAMSHASAMVIDILLDIEPRLMFAIDGNGLSLLHLALEKLRPEVALRLIDRQFKVFTRKDPLFVRHVKCLYTRIARALEVKRDSDPIWTRNAEDLLDICDQEAWEKGVSQPDRCMCNSCCFRLFN
ncbi:ankyrin repeat domain-containing protein [Aspergillus ibericus CBS 121593]|uniref:Ankyrin n=1 Tax=Aspergillus ibericus CBS 121593 TaxID=1448316 RepID=A0A395HIN1_9EURO|nr:ankyrin [Aspergillus ibericus CBS 121593]RAL06124.1 ankyrin [Aspergillus ibericus CBS 121593]